MPKFVSLGSATLLSFHMKQPPLLLPFHRGVTSCRYYSSHISFHFFVVWHFLANSMVLFETWTFSEFLETSHEVRAGLAFKSFASLTNEIFDTVPISIIKLQFSIFATMTSLLRQLTLKITNSMIWSWTNLSNVVKMILNFFCNSD